MGLTPRLVIGAVYRQLGEQMKVGGASGRGHEMQLVVEWSE